MSYDVRLYRKELATKYPGPDFDFLEDETNIPKFSDELFENIKQRLIRYKYQVENETPDCITFNYKGGQDGITVQLFHNMVAFNCAGFGSDGVFEISQTASEFTLLEDLAKLDPQDGGWEKID
jgi:hypothetical protein